MMEEIYANTRYSGIFDFKCIFLFPILKKTKKNGTVLSEYNIEFRKETIILWMNIYIISIVIIYISENKNCIYYYT